MRHTVLRKLLQRIPFAPLRLHMSNGIVFDVNDPDWVAVTPSTVELLVPADDGQHEAVINLLHIIWIEVLPAANSESSA